MPETMESRNTEANVLIIATSLNPNSKGRLLADHAFATLRERYPNLPAEIIDLREIDPLPIAGSPQAWEAHTHLEALKARLLKATHVLLAVPVYNYGAGSAVKNLIELMVLNDGDMGGKTVGFLCSAGGPRSYMSILGLANSLMLDFRCWIVPRFVYATGQDFQDGQVVGKEVILRIGQLADEMFEHGPAPQS